jgi:DNA-binding LytR/AlgR family response regulator
MKKVNCIIIDDSEDAIEIIKLHFSSKLELNLVETFTKPLVALDFVLKNSIELIFIDIEMPDLTGLDFIETLHNKKDFKLPSFIIITGFSEYAIKGYDYDIIHFLMKPVSFKKFDFAVEKYLAKNPLQNDVVYNDFFFVDVDGKKTRVDVADLVYIESAGNYLSIFKSNKRIVIIKSLNDIEKMLDPKYFMRIHKSFIVAFRHIETINNTDVSLLYNAQTVIIPIGRTYKEELKKRLKLF